MEVERTSFLGRVDELVPNPEQEEEMKGNKMAIRNFHGTWDEAEKAACICTDDGQWQENMGGYGSVCMKCHAEVMYIEEGLFQIAEGRSPTLKEEMDKLFDSFQEEKEMKG